MQEHEQYAKQIGVLKNGLNTVLEINQKEDNRELVDTMNRRMLSLEQTVRTKKEVHFNITKSGLSTWIKAAQSNTEFLDEYYD
jgi:macrodomain Ter protein organizer (MatP/YcbG family)